MIQFVLVPMILLGLIVIGCVFVGISTHRENERLRNMTKEEYAKQYGPWK